MLLYVRSKVSRAPAVLPFLLDDAARSQTDIDASQSTERPLATVPQVRTHIHIGFMTFYEILFDDEIQCPCLYILSPLCSSFHRHFLPLFLSISLPVALFHIYTIILIHTHTLTHTGHTS